MIKAKKKFKMWLREKEMLNKDEDVKNKTKKKFF